MVKNQEKWFSWGWLIFWTVFTGIGGVLYIIIKLGDRNVKRS